MYFTLTHGTQGHFFHQNGTQFLFISLKGTQCLFTSPFLSLRRNPIPIFSPRWNRTPISFIQMEPNANFFHPPGTQWQSYAHMAPKAHFQMEPNASFTLTASSICLIHPLRNPLSINFSWMKTKCPFLSPRWNQYPVFRPGLAPNLCNPHGINHQNLSPGWNIN